MNRPLRILIRWFATFCALLMAGSAAALLAVLIKRSAPVMDLALLFGDTPPLAALTLGAPVFDGLFPAICGTFCLVLLAVSLALPCGICAGIHLAIFASPRMRRIIGLSVDLLSGVPSILVGLFGFTVILAIHRIFPSARTGLLPAAASLACLVLPYIVRSTSRALRDLPPTLRKTAPALGANRVQNLRHVLLPAALPGMTSGLFLAIGRCAEDTAVILLTGAVAAFGLPGDLFSPFEALPFFIYTTAAEYTSEQELSMGFAAALMLLVICSLLFAAAAWIRHRILKTNLISEDIHAG